MILIVHDHFLVDLQIQRRLFRFVTIAQQVEISLLQRRPPPTPILFGCDSIRKVIPGRTNLGNVIQLRSFRILGLGVCR